MNQNTTNLPDSQKAPIPRPVLTFADMEGTLRAYCPACGEFALEIDEANKQPIVKCSHCGFQSPLNRFTVQHRDAMHTPVADYPLQSLRTPQTHNGTPQAQRPQNYLFESRPFFNAIAEAAQRPRAEMLFDRFWHEFEVAFLFGDTGTGKSALAIQISDAIARGMYVQHLQGTQRPRKVLYVDCELSDLQQATRYSDGNTTHRFSENLVRVQIRDVPEMPPNMKFEHAFMESLIAITEAEKAEAIVIDNLTYLRPNLEDAEHAILLMQNLKAFARRKNLSLLIISHTPKLPARTPITINSMQGSKQLVSFADAVFAIGKIPDEPNRRYLIQLKCRSAELRYHADNVLTATLDKCDAFLGFTFDSETTSEDELLKPKAESETKQTVIALSQQGLSQTEIAKRVGISQSKVSRILSRTEKPLDGSPF